MQYFHYRRNITSNTCKPRFNLGHHRTLADNPANLFTPVFKYRGKWINSALSLFISVVPRTMNSILIHFFLSSHIRCGWRQKWDLNRTESVTIYLSDCDNYALYTSHPTWWYGLRFGLNSVVIHLENPKTVDLTLISTVFDYSPI